MSISQTRTKGGAIRLLTEAEYAREQAGLSPEQLARKAGIGVRHLQACERRGCDCLATAERLRRAVGCRVEFYLDPRLTRFSKLAATTAKHK